MRLAWRKLYVSWRLYGIVGGWGAKRVLYFIRFHTVCTWLEASPRFWNNLARRGVVGDNCFLPLRTHHLTLLRALSSSSEMHLAHKIINDELLFITYQEQQAVVTTTGQARGGDIKG